MARIRRALESILTQIDDRFEVVIVDSLSNDGSEKVLDEFEASNKIRLFRTRCTRGRGRQIAHESAIGEYEIAQIDLDDVMLPNLNEMLRIYHDRCEGILIRTNKKPVTVAPRLLITELGGWSDLQNGEDWDLWSRAARNEKYGWISFGTIERNPVRHPERRSTRGKIKESYLTNRDRIRLGRRLRGGPEPRSFLVNLIIAFAWLRTRFMKSYTDPFNKGFNSLDSKYERTLN